MLWGSAPNPPVPRFRHEIKQEKTLGLNFRSTSGLLSYPHVLLFHFVRYAYHIPDHSGNQFRVCANFDQIILIPAK